MELNPKNDAAAAGAKRILLLPGEFRVSRGAEVIETLVGSCVAVCIYNTKTGRAAMNHFLRAKPLDPNDPNIGQYGLTSTEHIINALFQHDSNPGHYTAQVFGGAAVVKTHSGDYNIGQNNIAVAHQVLAAHHIRITHEETGGTRGRRIRFNTENNTVFCRFAGQVAKKFNPDKPSKLQPPQ